MFQGLIELATHIWRHFTAQNCLRMATALSYQTLLAIVPTIALALSLITYIDAYYSLQEDIILFLFDNLLPSTISQVHELLQELILNAEKLTYFGMIGLAITALLLLSSIETVFRQIWLAKTTRNPFKRLLAYILIISLGPIALSTSLTLVRWFSDLTEEASGLSFAISLSYFSFLIPFFVIFITLFLLYQLVPSAKIDWRHATVGAAVSAGLFVLSKYVFKLYILSFPSYQALYGALAILPLFLVWLYICWSIVLLGATITAVLGFRAKTSLEETKQPRS